MSEYKFNCPSCGQHILADEKWVGSRINCPSCNTGITLPALTKERKEAKAALPPGSPRQGRRPILPGDLLQTDSPAAEVETASTPTTPPSAREMEGNADKARKVREQKADASLLPSDQGGRQKLPGSSSSQNRPIKEAGAETTPPAKTTRRDRSSTAAAKVAGSKPAGGGQMTELPVRSASTGTPLSSARLSSPQAGEDETVAEVAESVKPKVVAKETTLEAPLRVAALSPAVKLGMVRGVRQRIADESRWLPGRVKGASAYAAKMQAGEVILLDAKSPEATRFSLIGAFLREMDVRRVVRSATGRRRFLDEEVPDAIHEVLLEGISDEEREEAEKRLSGEEMESISHAQCLAVLGVLERRYQERAEQLEIERAKRRLGSVRLPELVKKLEQKARISPEEVATALYHELMEVRRRLERLESGSGEAQ